MKRKLLQTNKNKTASSMLPLPPLPMPVGGFEIDALAKKTPHEKDNNIRFEEQNHKYMVRYNDNISDEFTLDKIVSVSGLVHSFFPKFDAMKIIHQMRSKGRMDDPNDTYFDMSNRDIIDLWKQNSLASSATGTSFHYMCECFVNGWTGINVPEYMDRLEVKQFMLFQETFMKPRNLTPLRSEFRMYMPRDLSLCGTIDLLCIDTDHPPPEEVNGVLTLVIVDWKNSKEIKESGYNKGFSACRDLDDCNLVHYKLQQGLYKYMLESQYKSWTYNGHTYTDVHVKEMFLCICHQNYGDTPKIIQLDYLESVIRDMLKIRINEIAV